MKAENYTDNFYEHNQHREHLSRIGHVEEDAEDIDGQQRQNDRPDGAHHDFLEIVHHVLQCRSVEARQSDTMFFQRYKIPEIHKYGNFLCMDAKLRFPFCFASVEKVFEVYFK